MLKIPFSFLVSHFSVAIALFLPMLTACNDGTPRDPSTIVERKLLREGNEQFVNKHPAEAEVSYSKAIAENPSSAMARFNRATAMLDQAGNSAMRTENDRDKGGDDPIVQAVAQLDTATQLTVVPALAGAAQYDKGNVAFAKEDYAHAVEFYKNALRCNPDDDQARDNLRLAQLRLKQQQQDQQQNQQQNQDKQNQDKQSQDKQDQDKQNQDKQNQDKQNQDKQNQDKQNQDRQNQDRQPAKPQQGDLSEQGVEQVLKAMQDQEKNTQRKAAAIKAEQERRERQRTNRKW